MDRSFFILFIKNDKWKILRSFEIKSDDERL